jgi:hypothetical protein
MGKQVDQLLGKSKSDTKNMSRQQLEHNKIDASLIQLSHNFVEAVSDSNQVRQGFQGVQLLNASEEDSKTSSSIFSTTPFEREYFNKTTKEGQQEDFILQQITNTIIDFDNCDEEESNKKPLHVESKHLHKNFNAMTLFAFSGEEDNNFASAFSQSRLSKWQGSNVNEMVDQQKEKSADLNMMGNGPSACQNSSSNIWSLN